MGNVGEVLIAAAGAELQDSLDTDTDSLQFLPDNVLTYLSAQYLNQQTHTAILLLREGVKTENPYSYQGITVC